LEDEPNSLTSPGGLISIRGTEIIHVTENPQATERERPRPSQWFWDTKAELQRRVLGKDHVNPWYKFSSHPYSQNQPGWLRVWVHHKIRFS